VESASKPALEPIYPPQVAFLLKEPPFQIHFLKVRNSPEVILIASLSLGPPHRLPLQQVGRHLLTVLIGGSSIEIPGTRALTKGHKSADELPLDILPLRLGEFVRAGMLSERTGAPFIKSFTVILVERLLDGVAILALLLPATTKPQPVIDLST
jgi:hypothetical protein